MTSVWAGLRGRQAERMYFETVAQRDRLSHAYLLVGPAGIGKRTFAERLAQCLLCQNTRDEDLEACGTCGSCRPLAAGMHPDLLRVDRPSGKRELPIELFLGARESRGQEGLCHELSLKPVSGRRKIAIIDDADCMNDASGNALLKTLEEPPEGAVLLLVASNLDALLSTIRSRCQLVRFAPLPPTDIVELLLEQDTLADRDHIERVAEWAEGSLAVARQLLSPEMQQAKQLVTHGLSTQPIAGVAFSEPLLRLLDDVDDSRSLAQGVLKFAVEHFRCALRGLVFGAETIPEGIRGVCERWRAGTADPVELIGAFQERCAQAVEQLDGNAALALCIEAWSEDLWRMDRGH